MAWLRISRQGLRHCLVRELKIGDQYAAHANKVLVLFSWKEEKIEIIAVPSFLSRWDCLMSVCIRPVIWNIIPIAFVPRLTYGLSLL